MAICDLWRKDKSVQNNTGCFNTNAESSYSEETALIKEPISPNKAIGPLMLLVPILSNILSIIAVLILRNHLSGIVILLLNAVSVTTLSIFVPSYLFIKKKKQPNDYFNLYSFDANQIFPCILLGIGIMFLATLANTLCYIVYELLNITLPTGSSELLNGLDLSRNSTFFTAMLCICVLPAIAEELLCRSAILYSLRSGGIHFAAIVSGLYFALLHGSILLLPTYLLMGYILGVIAYKTRSVYSSMIVHFIYNFAILVISSAAFMGGAAESLNVSVGISDYISTLLPLTIGGVIFLIPGFILFFKNCKKNDVQLAAQKNITVTELISDYNGINNEHHKVGLIAVIFAFAFLIGLAVLNDFFA